MCESLHKKLSRFTLGLRIRTRDIWRTCQDRILFCSFKKKRISKTPHQDWRFANGSLDKSGQDSGIAIAACDWLDGNGSGSCPRKRNLRNPLPSFWMELCCCWFWYLKVSLSWVRFIFWIKFRCPWTSLHADSLWHRFTRYLGFSIESFLMQLGTRKDHTKEVSNRLLPAFYTGNTKEGLLPHVDQRSTNKLDRTQLGFQNCF